MGIAWKYLDKRLGTEEALKDYQSMRFIIENTCDAVCEEHDRMVGMRSPAMDGMPHAHNPGAFEDRVIEGIDSIDELVNRYQDALEYMKWFEPAWEQLSEDERYVLSEFYRDGGEYGDRAAQNVMERFSIERTSAYRRKSRALGRLTTLLFGKG